ncbi:rolling circle replication-associated protein [Metasolibacillus meyeri]|uniref:rolling circle replication-associated protein n=1 Tax=Metasolibacillus meyeri TaxID=1071052 RepID=UPI000D30E672|nr:hypothetical protein [Metasolibacillus meyeri]
MKKKKQMKHVLAAYEEAFGESELTEMHEARLLDKVIAGYRTKSIYSGSVLEVETYPYYKIPQKDKRIKRDKNSTKVQERLNMKNRQKHVARLINVNFRVDDLYMTYTYEDGHLPADFEQSKKDMTNLIRRMKNWLKKQVEYVDFELKYIYSIEHTKDGEKVRAHSHMVTNFPDREIAEKLWKKGFANSKRLKEKNGMGFTELGYYLVKEKGEKTRKGYTPSRNLDTPRVTFSETKITRRRAAKIATEEISAQEEFEKLYKNYQFEKMDVSFSEYASGAYIHVYMQKVDNPIKNKRRLDI